jgi:hypothetical protein
MKVLKKILLYLMMMTFCLSGCSSESIIITTLYEWGIVAEHSGLPEQIYINPCHNDYFRSHVAVFKFRGPAYAKGMGTAASESLYEALLSNAVFVSVKLETDVPDLSTDHLMDIARSRNYDIIITGDLLYYFEGSLQQPSRVDERIRVIDVAKSTTLWYAKAMQIGPPIHDTDHIFTQRRGAQAPTTWALLRRNGEKFCKMLLEVPAQEFPATAQKEEELGKQGYNDTAIKNDGMEDELLEILYEEEEEHRTPAVVAAEEAAEPKSLTAEEESGG